MDFELIFDEYVNRYDTTNKNIKLKYEHSYRVADLQYTLAKKMKWDTKDIIIAFFIGLYHDIGRFEQIKKYDTFDDKESIDHAMYGIKILFDENLISNFNFNIEEEDIIKYSIYNHNKYKLQPSCDDRKYKHATLIRDVDKIDILKVFATYKNLNINLKEAIPDKMDEYFLKQQLVDDEYFKKHHQYVDPFLRYMSFVYDLNYIESFDLFKNNLAELYKTINLEYRYEKYYNKVLSYINECKKLKK